MVASSQADPTVQCDFGDRLTERLRKCKLWISRESCLLIWLWPIFQAPMVSSRFPQKEAELIFFSACAGDRVYRPSHPDLDPS